MSAIAGAAWYVPSRRAPAAVLGAAGRRTPGVESVRIAAPDEDALTMAIAAAARLDAGALSSLLVASTTFPYHRRVQVGIVAEALGIAAAGVLVGEFTTSARAGTEALCLLDATTSQRGPGLLLAAEAPRDPLAAGGPDVTTRPRGAGAVALLLADEGDIGQLLGDGHAVAEFPGLDTRRAGDPAIRDLGVPGYAEEALTAVCDTALADLEKRCGVSIHDHQHVVATAPDRRLMGRYLRQTGIDQRWRGGAVHAVTGDLGAVAPLLGLLDALSAAEPGDRILLLAYGGGSAADAVSLEAGPGAARVEVDVAAAPARDVDLAEYLRLMGFADGGGH